MKKTIVLFLLLFTITPCYAKRLHPEAEYQKAWCDKRGGLMEYKLSDKTRVDCLLPNMAVEDLKYLYRLRRAAYKKGVNLRTFTMKPEHLCIPINNNLTK